MRQKRLLKLVVLLLTAAVFSAPVSAADSGAGTMLQSHHTVIAPGFASYVRTYSGDQGQRQRGVSLELAPDSSVYPIVMACDTIWGGMTMDTAVRYAQMQGRRVVAAVNTAFYNSPGVPIGLVVEDGRLRSAAEGLNAFAILPDGSYYTAKAPKVYFELSSPAWGTEVLESRRLNKLFEREQLNIYTEDYSTVSTRVEEDAWAVRMAMDGAIGLEGSVTLTVTEVLPQTRAVPIGPGNLILTAGTSGTYAELFRRFQVGDTITMTTHCPDATLRQARYVTGCGDILVENGVITKEEEWMQTIAGQHPRSLLGWRRDGTLVVYTADGRDPGTADGLSLRMAAEELLRQGCVYGVNLDGGGSAVLGAQLPGRSGVEVLNRPSDGGQRQCAAYLLLVTDQTPDGVARYWHLDQNQRMVLPGQKLPLTVFGTDRALGPAGDPNQPLCFASAQGVLKENLYVAPQTGGPSGSPFGGTMPPEKERSR